MLKKMSVFMCLMAISLLVVPKSYCHHHCEGHHPTKEHSAETKIQKSTSCSICDLHVDHFIPTVNPSWVIVETFQRVEFRLAVPTVTTLHPIFSNKGPPTSC